MTLDSCDCLLQDFLMVLSCGDDLIGKFLLHLCKGLACGMKLFQHGCCLFGRHFVNVVPISYDVLARNCDKTYFWLGKKNKIKIK